MNQVLTITDIAAQQVKQIMANAPDENIIGLRIKLAKKGCSGMSYQVEYAHDVQKFEEVITDKGVKIMIDPAAIMFLIGTEMDWRDEKFTSSFVFKNPNEKARCGCGESFMV